MEDHQIVETASKYILALGPEALTIVAIIALAYIPRFVPLIPNKLIPLFCILVGPAVYPFIGDPGKISFKTTNPVVAQVLIGIVLGVIAWALHDQVISRLEGLLLKSKQPNTDKPDYTNVEDGK